MRTCYEDYQGPAPIGVVRGVKKLMLDEMVARVMKILIKQRFRKTTEEVRSLTSSVD